MADEEKRPESENEEQPAQEQAESSEASETSADTTAATESAEAEDKQEEAAASDNSSSSEAAQKEEAPAEVAAAVAHDSHGHGHGDHGDEHFAHPLSMQMLLAVLGGLLVLTILTVAVTAIDLGSQGNFIVAMIIATVKAILVMGIFMHMIWDNKFNVVAFTSSFLFVLLFLAMTVLDRNEYSDTVDAFEADKKIEALQ